MMPARKASSATSRNSFDQSFASVDVQEAVKSIYSLDEYLSTSSAQEQDDEGDTDSILPHVLNLLNTKVDLVRPVTLLKSLASKNRYSAALLVASDS